MTRADVLIIFIVWSGLLGSGAFFLGDRYASAACVAREVQSERKDGKLLKQKNGRALAAGVRAEQAQDAADTFFQTLRTQYENDQHEHPGTGCVLDAVSLRRWNDANAQSDRAAAGEPADDMPAAAPAGQGDERGE